MKRLLPLFLVLLTALGVSCASPSEHIAAFSIDGTVCGGGQAGAADDAGVADSGVPTDAGSDAADASADAGPPPPVPYAYMVLRQGQSDSLPVATFAGSPLSPWVAPSPTVHYWQINSARGLDVTTFGPLGGKFGSELSLGVTLDSAATPLYMSTVAIGGTQCPAALPPGPGYYTTLILAIDTMLAVIPNGGPFPVPLNIVIDQGQTDAQASGRSISAHLTCMQSVAANARAEVARVDGNSLRRVHFVVDQIPSDLPETIGTTTPIAFSISNIRAAKVQFVAADPDAVLIETTSLGRIDGFHYLPSAFDTLGRWQAAACVGVP